jgi:hypothetical protein
VTELLQGALLTLFGAVIGAALTLVERVRARREADKLRSAAWQVAHSTEDLWTLTNVGDAPASDIKLGAEELVLGRTDPDPEAVEVNLGLRVVARRSLSLAPGESEAIRLPSGAFSGSAQLLISWKSQRGVLMGPVRKYIPPR